jgi:phosphatidylglycerol:prolipoprotein diacylglycerol transferase
LLIPVDFSFFPEFLLQKGGNPVMEFKSEKMNTLIIHLPLPQHQFSLCYSLAFITALLFLLYEGARRKFPLLPWILIISFSQILFIIGTKLFSLSHDEWESTIKNLALVPSTKKELFGGLLFLGLGLWIGKIWMKFRPNFIDAFAIPVPLALTLQKAGCFFAGCCFGKPCNLPWAVQYPVYTLPHYHHFGQGLIGQGDLFSLPVHPAQLYELTGTLLIVFLVVIFQKRWKAKGSSFLFSIALYLFVRFIAEFFKDPLAHTTGGAVIGILNQTQWGILAVLPMIVTLHFIREIRWKPSSLNVQESMPALPSVISLLSISALLIFALAKWFEPMETLAILTFFIFAAILTLLHIFQNYAQISKRLIYICLLAIPFILMGQTLPEQVKDSVLVRRSRSIGAGFSTGNYDNSNERYIGEGCDRISNTAYFNQKYTLVGASLNFKSENLTRASEVNYGVRLLYGNHTETLLRINEEFSSSSGGDKQPIFDIHPYFRYDIRWVGAGAGFHAGKLSYTVYGKEKEGYGTPGSGRKITPVWPSLYLRVGPRDIAFVDYHLSDHFPSALPAYAQMIGAGTGLGLNNGTALRLGTLIGNVQSPNDWDIFEMPFHGIYVTGFLPLKKGMILEPLILIDTSEDTQKADFHFSLGLWYEFGSKTVTRPAIPLK